jgi:predicted transcriptional regulator
MFFKPYQIASLELLWSDNKSYSSREVWTYANIQLEGSISRASVINFLNSSADHGLLNYMETTGKGGYRRLYSAKYSKSETAKYLSNAVKKRLETL